MAKSSDDLKKEYNSKKDGYQQKIDSEESTKSILEFEKGKTKECYDNIKKIIDDELKPKVLNSINNYCLDNDWKGNHTHYHVNNIRGFAKTNIENYISELKDKLDEMSESIEQIEKSIEVADENIKYYKEQKDNVDNTMKSLGL